MPGESTTLPEQVSIEDALGRLYPALLDYGDEEATLPIDLLRSGETRGREHAVGVVRRHLGILKDAARQGVRPSTPLFALLGRDDISAGEVAGHTGCDPLDAQKDLEELVFAGLVVATSAEGRQVYSLVDPS